MSNTALPNNALGRNWGIPGPSIVHPLTHHENTSLAASITKAASRQTYYTVRFLVDPDRLETAYRAYAYFRWVDDWLDQPGRAQADQKAFVERQQALVARYYRGERCVGVTAEEQMLADLIASDHDTHSGLRFYIQNMMQVMAFDANRRGSIVSGAALDSYSQYLAVAVTEALHYFIGHDVRPPHTPARYLAATGAHIVHMLRDAAEDTALGYVNIPGEYLKAHRLDPGDFESDAYRAWVRQRVELAKAYFQAGKGYLAQVASARCRLAAFAYMARFKLVLRVMEQDDYRLRPTYQDCKGWPAMLLLGCSVLPLMLTTHRA